MSIYNRRYYIHKVLKPVIKIRAKGKTVSLTTEQRQNLTEEQLCKLFELQKIYNYSIQLEIPTDENTQTTTEPQNTPKEERHHPGEDNAGNQ